MIDLKVASVQTVLNFAHLLRENKYFEEAFQASRGGKRKR